jgi:hypothetical protein
MAKDPISETGDFNPKAAQIWRNLNSFASRCLGVGRSLLPSDVRYAISHAAKPQLWWARENIGYMDVTVEDEANYNERGTLYHGPPTMCLQRWGFWLDNFEELGKEESGMSEEIRKAALEAEQIMRTIERGIGHTLSE